MGGNANERAILSASAAGDEHSASAAGGSSKRSGSPLRRTVAPDLQNSARPPSSEGFGKSNPPKPRTGNRKRGEPSDHEGHSRDLYSIEVCAEVIDHYPGYCVESP